METGDLAISNMLVTKKYISLVEDAFHIGQGNTLAENLALGSDWVGLEISGGSAFVNPW